jgi:hypothetical protein
VALAGRHEQVFAAVAAAKDFVGNAIRVSAFGRGAHAKRKQPADPSARVF